MANLVQYLLLALTLTLARISYTESRTNEKRDKYRRRFHTVPNKDNICEITDRESKVHCYCENTEVKSATTADCWVFNGGIEESDPVWATFNLQPYIEKLSFHVRSNGALKFIPLNTIRQLKILQKLNIYYASLNKIEKGTFSNLTTIKQITLLNNKIVDLDFSAFTNLPSLVNLTIKGNKISEIQKDVFVNLPSLKLLDMSFNNISLTHDGCFEHLTALNELVLEANSISVLTREMFRGLSNLTQLDLRSNKLSMIGDLTFSELWNLNELLVDNNELKYLSERAFDGLALLQKLSMTGNKLKSINEGLLEGIRGLELLDLRNNEIEYFTYETVKPIIENLKVETSVLYLSGNKLKCDCSLSWIKTLRNETKSEPLKEALDEVSCILNVEESSDALENDPASDLVLNIEANTDKSQQDIDDDVEAPYFVEPTSQNVNEVSLIDLPIESMPCQKQKTEDSLMLSSKDESYWNNGSDSLFPSKYIDFVSLLYSIGLYFLFDYHVF